ncbi:MAG: glycosyltransferase family 2 protein [Verrucomicrobiae bacterium]|nr:glycosyltransferase family 2 protein [Verrucomicrobiae bacterium]
MSPSFRIGRVSPSMPSETSGISVLVCAHNAAARLPATLRHLAAQQTPPGLPWEVLVIDNASTDDTAATARSGWPPGAPARLRVVTEPNPGLRRARECGLRESCWPLVAFIDDDNWLAPDYLERAARLMTDHPEVAACGGRSEAVCEVPPPDWFPRHAHAYAVGPQGGGGPDEPGPRSQLWGAGLVLRRSALETLREGGFQPLSMGRTLGRLEAGEDTELCLALRLAGWQLWYDPGLRLDHWIPRSRLEWTYLRRLNRGFGATFLDPYWHELDPKWRGVPAWRRTWLMAVLRELRILPRWMAHWPRTWRRRGGEGDPRILEVEQALGRWAVLARTAGTFDDHCRAIRHAPWRRHH